MSLPFDKVVLSTNRDPKYWEFRELTPQAWKKFFPECQVILVEVAPPNGVPSGSWAKIARYMAAARFTDDVCLIHDIDTVPLQRDYTVNILSQRKAGHLLCVGAEVYAGTPHEGKFPAGHMTGEGRLFGQLLEGYAPGLPDMFDSKEDVRSTHFSDESMIRAQLVRNPDIPVQHVGRGVDIYRDWIDRSWWDVDTKRLWAGGYVECNMMRPWSEHREAMAPVVEYLRHVEDPCAS